jgi:hypothetical protein
MTANTASGKNQYRLERRTDRLDGKGKLSGFALDVSIKAADGGKAIFVDDANGNPMPFDYVEDVGVFIEAQLKRNYADHYGAPPAAKP